MANAAVSAGHRTNTLPQATDSLQEAGVELERQRGGRQLNGGFSSVICRTGQSGIGPVAPLRV